MIPFGNVPHRQSKAWRRVLSEHWTLIYAQSNHAALQSIKNNLGGIGKVLYLTKLIAIGYSCHKVRYSNMFNSTFVEFTSIGNVEERILCALKRTVCWTS